MMGGSINVEIDKLQIIITSFLNIKGEILMLLILKGRESC